MSFEGFSDVEIQKITTGRARKPDGNEGKCSTRIISKLFVVLVKFANKIPCHNKVVKHIEKKDENQNRTFVEMIEVKDHPAKIEVTSTFEPEAAPPEPVSQTVCIPTNGSIVIETSDDKAARLQDFELQRKLMEEQNKMKRSLLQDAISKHTEKTQAEAKKLNEIKLSLDVLDSELSNDVAILRKQIETTTLHFNNVEKHYCAIEKTFLKAKQDLYQAHEKKEMLTEHLYTIIAHNEDRKAKRLSELMEKVGLTLSHGNGT